MSKILFRLARQWMKERGISWMYGVAYLAACLARQLIEERGISWMYGVKCWVRIFSGLFRSAVDKRTRNN